MAAVVNIFSVVLLIAGAYSYVNGAEVGEARSFTLTINNQLEVPTFTESVDLKLVGQQNLLHYMGLAVDSSTAFSGFSGKWYDNLGLFITAINRIAGGPSGNTFRYWQIKNEGGSLDKGVSSYFPVKDDHVTFNFTAIQLSS